MKIAADRLLGFALIGLAAFAAIHAWQLQIPFSYEPVGPKAFPIVLSIILAALSLVLIFRPGENGHWPNKALLAKLLQVLGTLVVYAILFTKLGFIITTFFAALVLARLFGATWRRALIASFLMVLVSYFLFTQGLGISLPDGYWLSDYV
ncbi:putative tricarboxylic transport membrane protein [Chromohalobacter marismortui]|uniref:Putative tricarboxylic transport membrane protein n=1 Tax=Chromohalobacter marismortui TaxID=42055 RepID=A0A4R7NSA0_9GAMM|nr:MULTISPECIES: tripartite tricarboxylate transporter TctB family protein [Chromohalobacter]MCI0509203.1 tripartite tricarboxylate transporter TctB family protein [Chromohalobacter sp.]MCI0593894.1 tripartite tricarboxylate transporter TctB family protein [Chromohalobacter sp.]TDU23905.1 putative tricarboxylic transport membrane protein [Chromohalobacter marismortui]